MLPKLVNYVLNKMLLLHNNKNFLDIFKANNYSEEVASPLWPNFINILS